jgi:type IV pilus assembly protein PilW
MVAGYNGSGATTSFAQDNLANDSNAAHWTPALPTSLVGQVEQNNDVLIVLGATPGAYPLGIIQIDDGSNFMVLQSTGNTTLAAGQLGTVSDCLKSIIFEITGANGTTITHDAGSGSMQNNLSAFPVNFQVGSQFVPIQQTAFFVSQGDGGQSTLMRGILNGNTWTIEPLVPGVELMKVQYGIGTNSLITQYVSADSVTDWTKVYAVRLGFLIAGKIGSSSSKTSYTVLDTTVTVPTDNLLRHTFEMTIQLRNSI